MTAPAKAPEPFPLATRLAALVACWLCPGMGQLILGQTRKALILGLTIMTLWFAGLLIGGISVMNRHDDSEWFIKWGHDLMAPSVVAGFYLDSLGATASDTGVLPQPPYYPSFGRVKEQGTLYTSLAGFLNVLVMVDAFFGAAVVKGPQDGPEPTQDGAP